MLESLAETLRQSLQHVSLLAYLLAFAGGALTGFNPCPGPAAGAAWPSPACSCWAWP